MSTQNNFAHETTLDRDADHVAHVAPSESRAPEDQEVAVLAYALWEKRGCPVGSPDLDWSEAEATLQARPAAALTN